MTISHRVKIIRDESPESPDGWGNEDCFLVAFDKRNFWVERKGYEKDTFVGEDGLIENPHPDYHVFLLRAYIHSGVALSLGTEYPFNDSWDSGWIGYVLVSKAEWPDPLKARLAALAEVETWNQYLSGDIWGYVVEKVESCDLGHEHATEMDSCWGFYGEETAKEAGEALLKAYQEEVAA